MRQGAGYACAYASQKKKKRKSISRTSVALLCVRHREADAAQRAVEDGVEALHEGVAEDDARVRAVGTNTKNVAARENEMWRFSLRTEAREGMR